MIALVQNSLRRFILVSALATLSACASINQDGPPLHPIDVHDIADAVPKHEPITHIGNPDSYEIAGKTYWVKKSNQGYLEQGIASWYGTKFHGRKTSNGETYDMYAMTAAHTTLRIPSYARVTNLENDKSVIVRINDRGPFHDDRIIDLSYAAATKLDITQNGTGRVEVEAINMNANLANPGTPKGKMLSKTSLENAGTDSPNLFLQLGAFRQRQNAEQLLFKLKPNSEIPVQISEFNSEHGLIFRVRIGPIRDSEQMQIIRSQLGKMGQKNAFVVYEP